MFTRPVRGLLIREPVSAVDPAGLGGAMSNRMGVVLLAVLCATAASGVVSTVAAQARASDAERFTLVDEETILYEFTVEDGRD